MVNIDKYMVIIIMLVNDRVISMEAQYKLRVMPVCRKPYFKRPLIMFVFS
jgi:hypothetical protein